eukprot:3012231-Prymnesium_polylepis.1
MHRALPPRQAQAQRTDAAPRERSNGRPAGSFHRSWLARLSSLEGKPRRHRATVSTGAAARRHGSRPGEKG